MGELCAVIDGDGNVWIRGATTNLLTFDAARRNDGDLENTNSSVQGCARKQLLEIECEDVRIVHHGLESSVCHFSYKGRKTRYLETECQ